MSTIKHPDTYVCDICGAEFAEKRSVNVPVVWVARRLREIEERTMLDITDGELLDLLADKVRFGRYGSKNFDEGLLGRIADLIDRPTCRNIGGEDGTNGEYYDFFCSACGFAASVTDPKYCPNCGAEVVE